MELSVAGKVKKTIMYVENSAFSGVRRVADKVREDIRLVTGESLEIVHALVTGVGPVTEESVVTEESAVAEDSTVSENSPVIAVGTVGKSSFANKLIKEMPELESKLVGKREVYAFMVCEPKCLGGRSTLAIVGSDKRGTIYGLFHLSELLGVSPWIYFADVMPAKRDEVILTDAVNMISKEPSVKYRGFFINDEWPSFGNWTFSHFGGFTAEMYDHVFELLLRLKGNYLWPAMWTSSFSLDGPGIENARLADEYGIVMSNSHHEPCLRHSEEWDLVRGEGTPYGNDWNFEKNREGLTKYWKDGLKRNASFENIITIGMRGERDSKILGRDATMNDNVELLKDVIRTQKKLIHETVGEVMADSEADTLMNKSGEVLTMLALYKEVEAYYYGDSTTDGLKNWKELDGVTLMLCEDNFGNMRTLPTKQNKNRPGGWGMYYHFDYHGDPVSYEWVNSTDISKVWEQMTMAYEFGIRDIWIVNVGDLKPQELPLSYFLDLAYDYDKWGINAPNATEAYVEEWAATQFGGYACPEQVKDIADILKGYSKMNSIRKPEALGPDTYHPVNYGEADEMLTKIYGLEQKATTLMKQFADRKLSAENMASFYELVFYPVMASANVHKMQIFAGRDKLFAGQGRVMANHLADCLRDCMNTDKKLTAKFHNLLDGKWDGMMRSEHIGFVHWNDEECRMPVRHYIEPSDKPRMIVSVSDQTQYTMGGDWTRRVLQMDHFLNPYTKQASIDIANGSLIPFAYQITCDAPWLTLSATQGEAVELDRIFLTIDRSRVTKEETVNLKISTSFAWVMIQIAVRPYSESECEIANHTVSEEGVAIEATECVEEFATEAGIFKTLLPFGKYESAKKAFPIDQKFIPGKDAPALTYECYLVKEGMYEITIQTAPSNPIDTSNQLYFGFAWDDEPIRLLNMVTEDYISGERECQQWAKGVLDQIHNKSVNVAGKKGLHKLHIYACDPGFVLERILIRPVDHKWQEGYFGPKSLL